MTQTGDTDALLSVSAVESSVYSKEPDIQKAKANVSQSIISGWRLTELRMAPSHL